LVDGRWLITIGSPQVIDDQPFTTWFRGAVYAYGNADNIF
jgi:hypothetical protein